jgi:hypothetical protein
MQVNCLTLAALRLRLPKWQRQFILHVDWNCKAVGAALSHKDGEGGEYPIAFASRLLTSAEKRYAPLFGLSLAYTHEFCYNLQVRSQILGAY